MNQLVSRLMDELNELREMIEVQDAFLAKHDEAINRTIDGLRRARRITSDPHTPDAQRISMADGTMQAVLHTLEHVQMVAEPESR